MEQSLTKNGVRQKLQLMIQTEIIQNITKRTLGLTFVLSAAALAFAQEKVNVTGNVVANGGTGVPYASVEFFHKTNKLFSDAALTDESGNYQIQLVPGNYDIVIEAIDFKKFTTNKVVSGGRLETFRVVPEESATLTPTQDIEGVTITAQPTKPYRVELDKKVYDPAQDVISKGGNLQDVLQNVPSVSVETDGTVSMRGNSNVRFLINGKPSSMLGIDDGANAMQAIPADQIERIEVITNPSSKFEASGTAGILNIILKKSKKMGFNGSVTGTVGYLPNTGLNTNLSWRRGNVTWFLNGGGSYRRSEGVNNYEAWFKDTGRPNQMLTQKADSENPSEMKSYNGTAGMVYDFNDKTSANISVSARAFENESNNNITTLMTYNGIDAGNTSFLYPLSKNRNTKGFGQNRSFQGDFGIDHKFDDNGQNIAFSLSLQKNNSENESGITELRNNIHYRFDETASTTESNNIIGKIDYELPIGEKSKLEAGYRFDRNQNDYDYSVWNAGIVNPDFTSITNYKEMFNAFYVQFKSKIGERFGYQLGLRDEISKVNVDFRNLVNQEPAIDKTYNNIFPSVFLSYDVTDSSQILLNYSKRINRPRSWFLVPFRSYSDSDNIFSGNPDLNPSFVNSFELGYSIQKRKMTINPTVYFNHETDETQMVNIYNFERQRFETKPYNIGTEQRYGLDMNFTYDPFTWLRFMGNVDLFGYKSDGEFNYTTLVNGVQTPASVSFEGNGFSTRTRLTTTFRIDRTFNVQLQGFYRGGQETANSKSDPMYALNLGASKTIWNGNGTVNFNIQDIFNTRARSYYTFGEGFERKSFMQWAPRQFSISLTYRFKEGDQVTQPRRKKDINSNANGGDDEMPPM